MDTIITILNSNFFVGLVTLIAGLVTLVIYTKNKKDSKKDAANIILLEIQNAERTSGQISQDVRSGTLPNKFLLPNDSWSKYKYLFVRDFDRDEWDLITQFYDGCRLYDEAVSYNNSLFQKNEEQIRVNMLRAPADYIKEYLNNSIGTNDTEEEQNRKLEHAFYKSAEFQRIYLSKAAEFLLYNPQKPLTDGKNAFESLNRNISQTSIGSKLKNLAGLK